MADRYTLERELGRGLTATLGVARFVREIEIAAQLTHPHILPLFDSSEAAGHLYTSCPASTGNHYAIGRSGASPQRRSQRCPRLSGTARRAPGETRIDTLSLTHELIGGSAAAVRDPEHRRRWSHGSG